MPYPGRRKENNMDELNHGLNAVDKDLEKIQKMLDSLDERIAEFERRLDELDELNNEIRVLSAVAEVSCGI